MTLSNRPNPAKVLVPSQFFQLIIFKILLYSLLNSYHINVFLRDMIPDKSPSMSRSQSSHIPEQGPHWLIVCWEFFNLCLGVWFRSCPPVGSDSHPLSLLSIISRIMSTAAGKPSSLTLSTRICYGGQGIQSGTHTDCGKTPDRA